MAVQMVSDTGALFEVSAHNTLILLVPTRGFEPRTY